MNPDEMAEAVAASMYDHFTSNWRTWDELKSDIPDASDNWMRHGREVLAVLRERGYEVVRGE